MAHLLPSPSLHDRYTHMQSALHAPGSGMLHHTQQCYTDLMIDHTRQALGTGAQNEIGTCTSCLSTCEQPHMQSTHSATQHCCMCQGPQLPPLQLLRVATLFSPFQNISISCGASSCMILGSRLMMMLLQTPAVLPPLVSGMPAVASGWRADCVHAAMILNFQC